MDPFIDPDALDPAHPLTHRKLDNLRRADDAYRAGAATVDALPSKVTLQTNDTCNLTCPHCQIPAREKRRRMERTWLDVLREQLLPDLVELHPTNLGEPFLWPWFKDLCRLLQEYGVLLDLTTNGTLLDAKRIAWVAPIARDVKVSFDGARAETFERFRRGASFDRTCGNVQALVARLRRIRVRRPTVALQMTLMRDNVEELPDLVRLAARLGADRVKAYHLFSFSADLDHQSLMSNPAWLERYETHILPETLEVGHSLGVDLQLAEPSGGEPEDLTPRTCFLPWHETWIDLDGSIRLCHSHQGRTAGTLEVFRSAWNGPLYRRVRAGFASGKPEGACRGCGMNFDKPAEHVPVPYDPASFLNHDVPNPAPVRWSGRMRPFDLHGVR